MSHPDAGDHGIRDGYKLALAAVDHLPGHRAAWDYLLERIPWYPRGRQFWPWKRATKKDLPRPIAMVGCAWQVRTDDNARLPVRWTRATGQRVHSLDVHGEHDDAERVASWLFGRYHRSTSIVLIDGSAWLFQSLLKWYARTWADLGYEVRPLVAGPTIRAIVVRKGNQRWTLCDLEAMTGTDVATAHAEAQAMPRRPGPIRADEWYLKLWLEELQLKVVAELGAYLRPTIAGTAVRAASHVLPDDLMIPRPPPFLVAMCREGRGFRGGFVYGVPFRGHAYKADVRRLYAACLRTPLGIRWAFGPGTARGREKPGVFLCTVDGTPAMPITLGVWDESTRSFTDRHWYGGTAIAVLPSSEYAGIRAMGCTVTPGWGWVATQSVTFDELVDKLATILGRYGSDSSMGRVAKLIGNTLYGRWAQNPVREGVVYSVDRPSERAFPMVTIRGDEVDDLWWQWDQFFSPAQQIGMAAMVTGHARSVLYAELAKRTAEGRTVVHAHTDGYVATGSPPDDMPTDTDVIGEWRVVGEDPDAIVLRGGGYTIGEDAKTSGVPGASRAGLEIAWSRGTWLVRGERATAIQTR